MDKKPWKRSRIAAVALVSLFGLYLVWWFWLRSPGPDEIAEKTVQALTKGDVNTLLSLTMPEEVTKLHLTKDGVQGFLFQTLYVRGLPAKMSVRLESDSPLDQRQYHLTGSPNASSSLHYPLSIMVNQRPDGRWYLALSYLLLNTCSLKDNTLSVSEEWAVFWELSDRYKINGVRLNTWGYTCKHHTCD